MGRNQVAKGRRFTLWLSSTLLVGCGTNDMNAPFLQGLPKATKALTFHPFLSDDQPRALAQFARGALTSDQTVKLLLAEHGLSPLLSARADVADVEPSGFALNTGSSRTEYRFWFGDFPIYDAQLVFNVLRDRSTLILGTVPTVTPRASLPKAENWPTLEDAQEALKAACQSLAATDQRGQEALQFGKAERYLYPLADGGLTPVWVVKVRVNGGEQFEGVAGLSNSGSGIRVYSLRSQSFDATGTAQVVANNKVKDQVQPYQLTDLVDNGTLTSTYLQTVVPSGYTQVKETSHSYSYEKTDQRFDEVQAYAHAQMHLSWFIELGFQWYGPKPIQIQLHVRPGGHQNNALFTPGDDSNGTKPSIQIDDGDGIDLQNLASDGDVVSHEFGHHVIYKTLRSTEGESLVLHEGLADAFVFARTGDPCLGESICPTGSGACVVDGQCLRTAANELGYRDKTWKDWSGSSGRLGHLHGQLISGFVWDLQKNKVMTTQESTRLVFKAISYFKTNSGFRDFLLALLTADRDLFSCKYGATIREVAAQRGMSDFLSGVASGCDALPSLSGGTLTDGSTTTTTPTTKKSKKGDDNPFACGTVAFDRQQASAFALVLLLLIPLIFALKPAPSKAGAPRRKARFRRPL